MKRLICAAAIITVIFAASFTGSHYVNTTLDELIFIAENNPENLADTWQSKRELLSVFLKNDDTDSIEELISTDFSTHELTALIKNIKDGEQLTLGNIF